MKICLAVRGSIAAYRSPDFVKALMAEGHEVKVILSKSASHFVSSLTLETFLGAKVLSNDAFSESYLGTEHISMARWADAFVVYGATADFLARYAQGMADDFTLLQLLATEARVYLVPAMNPSMWQHAAVQENIQKISQRGVHFVGPIEGQVACGESGVGHIASHEEILRALGGQSQRGSWSGKKILISCGPMRSSLDEVRYLQNRSTGKMGLELARAARNLGAHVSVLLGPVESELRREVYKVAHQVKEYTGATSYEEGLDVLFPLCDVFFSAAAVLDFEFESQKGKLENVKSTLSLPAMKAVKDFVAAKAQEKRAGQKIVAFALESSSLEQAKKRALEKLNKKKADLLLLNLVSESSGPGSDTNEYIMFEASGKTHHFAKAAKSALAPLILEKL